MSQFLADEALRNEAERVRALVDEYELRLAKIEAEIQDIRRRVEALDD